MFQRILVPVDGSSHAHRAAAVAGGLARRFGAQVCLLHVVYPPPSILAAAAGEGIGVGRLAAEALEREARAILLAAAEALALPEGQAEQLVRYGHPAEEILREAQEGKHELIVMGSRGLSETRAFLIGSVSDRVNHHAHCAVLLVR